MPPSPRISPMWLVTAEQMQTLDRRTIQEAHIPGTTLMERAGAGAVAHMLSAWGPPKGRTVVIVCGKGNNGGDGLVMARLLHKKGAVVHTVLLASPKELSPDAKTMYRRLTKLVRPSRLHQQPPEETLDALLANTHVVVDAILGTGLTSDVRDSYKTAIEAINRSSAKVLALDIPSGLDSNTGATLGASVRADLTVTFGYPKLGLYLGSAIDRAGQVELVDIGIPPAYATHLISQIQLITTDMVRAFLPSRPLSAHKGTYGHAGIMAGSPGKTGAAAMAGLSALRIGSGLVTVAVPQSVSPILESKLLEVMTDPMPESDGHQLGLNSLASLLTFSKNKSGLGIGPGLGVSTGMTKLLLELLPQLEPPCVLDADALNALAADPQVFSQMKCPPILTPHPGEMSRLLGQSVSAKSINDNRVGIAQDFAQRHRVILVLKGARTVVAEPGGMVSICPTGNPGMASAGMGDVLTGMMTGLLTQGLTPWDAAQAGVFLHGLAGDLAAVTIAQPSLIASDVISTIPRALTKILADQPLGHPYID